MIKFNEDEDDRHNIGSLKDQIWNAELQRRRIVINEEINQNLIEKAVLQVFNINQYDSEQEEVLKEYKREPIIIYINTNGGTIDEAFSLISAIESSKTPVVTFSLGKAWSAGFLILISGHHRICQKYGTLMYHQGSAGINGEFSRAIEYAEYWRVTQDRVEKFVTQKTKIKQKKLQEIFNKKQDWYIDPEEALTLGVIDEIV